MTRGIVIAALIVYAAVAFGCILSRSQAEGPGGGDRPARRSAGAERAALLPLRGVAVQLHRVDWMDDEYRRCVDEVADLGADAVKLVIPARMEHAGSNAIYLDMRYMPGPEALGRLIDHAKGRKLRVILMPIVLLDKPRTHKEWRGTIKPEGVGGWEEWWKSYRAMMHHFCWLAEKHKVDVLVVGSELVSTEGQVREWTQTIAEVRGKFKGSITYSANWDHYKEVTFWDQLDLIGMNSYYELGKNHNVTLGEIQQRWGRIKENLLAFQKTVDKPLVFLEVGWCSLQNAAHEPWDYTKDEVPVDLELQRRLFEGFFTTWHGTPQLGGYMVWEWPPGDGGPENRGYTPEGKPAEKVVREWIRKEWR